MKKITSKLIGVLIFIFCISILAIVFFPSLFDGLARYYYRDSGFKVVEKGNQEIFLLGTIHHSHWEVKGFSLLHLEAVIKNLHPDIVLVESRQEQLDQDNLGDGPPEMLFCDLTARENKIPVKGIDWWDVNTEKPITTDDERDTNISKNIIKYSNGYKKVLVLIGNQHIQYQLPKLENEGYKEQKFSNSQKDKLFILRDTTLIYPKGMNYYINKRITYEENSIGTLYKTKVFKDNAVQLIANFKELSKKVQATGERK